MNKFFEILMDIFSRLFEGVEDIADDAADDAEDTLFNSTAYRSVSTGETHYIKRSGHLYNEYNNFN